MLKILNDWQQKRVNLLIMRLFARFYLQKMLLLVLKEEMMSGRFGDYNDLFVFTDNQKGL